MLKLHQYPNGVWRIRGTVHGTGVDKSSKTRSRAEAEQIKSAWEKQIFAEVYGFADKQQNHTFAQAAESWILSGGNTLLYHYFDHVVSYMGDFALTDLTPGTIDQAAAKLFPTQKNSTINRGFYALVSVILNHAVGEGWCNPVRLNKRKVKKSRIDWHTPEAIEKLILNAGHMAPLISFIVGTGARTSEALRLEWKDVSPQGTRVTFWTTKGGLPRSVDLCERTRAALPPRGVGRVWRKEDGNPWNETSDGRFYGPRQKIKRICARNDLADVGLHSLRHSWASWQYALESDPLKLQVKGGWASLSMVLNYAHLASPDLADEVQKYGWFDCERGRYTGEKMTG